MVFPSCRNQNTSRTHAGNRRFPGVENSLIPPQFTCQFYWPVFDAKRGEHGTPYLRLALMTLKFPCCSLNRGYI
jgi:hypothetical protein